MPNISFKAKKACIFKVKNFIIAKNYFHKVLEQTRLIVYDLDVDTKLNFHFDELQRKVNVYSNFF